MVHWLLLFFFLLIALVLAVSTSRNPESALAIFERRVLTCEIVPLGIAVPCGTALRERTGAVANFRGDGGIGRDPVGEGVFAVLNGSVTSVRRLP